MTIRLLRAFDGYPANEIVSLDRGTEAGLVQVNAATYNIGLGNPYEPNQPFDVVPPVATAQRRSNTLVLIGDSIASNWYSESATGSAYLDFGFMTWANALSNSRFDILNASAADAGSTSRNWVSAIRTEVLPYNPGYVVCYLGTNDISSDITYEESISNFKAIFDQITANGTALIVCTVIPYGSGNALNTAARNVARSKLNLWLASYCTTNPNAYLVDTYSVVVDPASTTGAALANYLWDDLHPSRVGARAMGSAVSTVLRSITNDSSIHVSAFTDNYAYDTGASNRISNPLFNSASGAAGATVVGAGTVITATSIGRDWTVASTAGGTSTTVCTTPAAPDGFGNSQQLEITGTNATDQIILRTGSIASARLSTGNQLYGECFVSVASATALEGIRLTWFYQVDGVSYNYSCMSFTAGSAGSYSQSDLSQMVLRTPTFTVPQGALTSGQLSLNVFFDGAGGATVNVWRMALRRVN